MIRTTILFLIASVVVGGFGVGNTAAASEEPLVTDRPDITESSQVVGAYTWQVETSGQWRRFESGAAEANTWLTPTLFRFGVMSELELRLETNAFSTTSTKISGADGPESTGFSPISLGAKYQFLIPDEGSRGPSVAALAKVEVPSGSAEFSTDNTAGALVVIVDGDLNDSFSAGTNAGVDVFENEAGDVKFAGLFSAALGYGPWEKTAVFIEVAANGLGLSKESRAAIFDGGIVHLLSPNAQVDVAAGVGLTDETDPDFYVTVGFSFRAPYFGYSRGQGGGS